MKDKMRISFKSRTTMLDEYERKTFLVLWDTNVYLMYYTYIFE